MLVMLPAGLVGGLSSIGVRADAGWVQALARPFEPVAQPLLVVSALLLAAGSVACGWSPVAAALTGGTLLYLGMYAVTGPGGASQPALFYAGLALFVGAPVLTVVRPRLRSCRPLLARRAARRILLLAVAAGAVLLLVAPLAGWGRATAVLHAVHSRPAPAQPTGGERAGRIAPPVVRVQEDFFTWSGTVERYTSQDAWFPRISTDGAVLQVRGSLASGSIYVQVMDGAAAIVYEETFASLPPTGLSIETPGMRGVWMVTLGFRDYSGELSVALRSR